MENKILLRAGLGVYLSEVTTAARRMYPGYNLQTCLTHYLGFCWSVKLVRHDDSMNHRIALASLIIEAHENYKNN